MALKSGGVRVLRFRLAVLEGAAGSGKSVLLGALVAGAVQRELMVLRASAQGFQREYPFGVVRQLFEPAVSRLEPSLRGELFAGAAALAEPLLAGRQAELAHGFADTGFSLLHGLYWVLVGLSELRPVVLVIDDLQWCDAGSLRFLAFAIKRGEELPLLLAVAHGDGPADQQSGVLAAMVSGPAAIIRPAPLSVAAIASVLSGAAGCRLGEEVVAEAEVLTEGSPLYVRELADALRAARAAAAGDRLETLGDAAPAAVGGGCGERLRVWMQARGRSLRPRRCSVRRSRFVMR